LLSASRAFAQSSPEAAQPALQFFSRYDFHLSMAGLAEDDPRFSWDARFGGDFDLLEHALGRITFGADYQAIAGKELGAFDVNQGNYALTAAAAARVKGSDVVLELYHASRHLSDRAKEMRIAWNELEARLIRKIAVGQGTLDIEAQVGKVVAKAFVDYSWSAVIDGTVRRPLSPRVGVYANARGRTVGVKQDIYGRDQQYGGRVEGGVRFRGESAAVEVFGGYERVIDADAFEMMARHWAFAGFRVVNH
jgi:hypothetical protein